MRREAGSTGCPGFQELDMNKSNHFSLPVLAAALFAASTAFASPRPAVAEIIVDCQTRALPSQTEVGSMLGIDNLSAAYAARSRLMVDVAHACRRQGADQVRVTLAPAAGMRRPNRVASADRNPR